VQLLSTGLKAQKTPVVPAMAKLPGSGLDDGQSLHLVMSDLGYEYKNNPGLQQNALSGWWGRIARGLGWANPMTC